MPLKIRHQRGQILHTHGAIAAFSQDRQVIAAIGRLTSPLMQQIDDCLKSALGLS